MSNRRKTRSRNALFDALTTQVLAHGHYTVKDDPGRTQRGTVLEAWMYSISPDGILPHCAHAVPGQPTMLCTDDPDPKVRCARCMQALRGLADDGICHLCGKASGTFREFTFAALHELVIIGNACDECFADMWRGRPVPPSV